MKIFLRVLLICGGLGALCIALIVVFFDHFIKDEPATEADLALVVTAEKLCAFFEDSEPEPESVEATRTTYFDGSWEVNYEYSPVNDSLYMSSSTSMERSEMDAKGVLVGLWTGSTLSFKMAGSSLGVREDHEFFKYGDESKFAFLLADDEITGNLFVCRQGSRVFYLILSGGFFDDAETFGNLVRETLENIEKHGKE